MDKKQTQNLYVELFSPCPDWDEQERRLKIVERQSEISVQKVLQAAIRFVPPFDQGDTAWVEEPEDIKLTIAGFRHALDNIAQQDHPIIWAMLQHNLGSALTFGGANEAAISAFESTLKIYNSDNYPELRANTLSNIADVFVSEGRNLEALNAFDEAVSLGGGYADEIDRGRLEVGRGLAYLDLLDDDMPNQLSSARRSFQIAAEIFSNAEYWDDWAYVQVYLGHCYAEDQVGDFAENVEMAIGHYQNALSLFPKRLSPEEWAMAQLGLGAALSERIFGDPVKNGQDAITALQAARRVFRPSTFPEDHAKTVITLACVYLQKPEPEPEKALVNLKRILPLIDPHENRQTWIDLHINLANAYRARRKGHRRKNMLKAMEVLREALTVCGDRSVDNFGSIHVNLGAVCIELHRDFDEPLLDYAEEVNKTALSVISREAFPDYWTRTKANQASVYMAKNDWPSVSEIAEEVLNLSDDALRHGKSIYERTRLIKAIAVLNDLGTLALNQQGKTRIAFAFACRSRSRFLRAADIVEHGLKKFQDARTLGANEAYIQFTMPMVDELSLAFIVTREGISAIQLELFGRANHQNLLKSWGEAYRKYADVGITETPQFQAGLEDVLSLLSRTLAPIIDGLRENGKTKLVVAPSGLLSLFPLHAVTHPGDDMRRLLDEFEIIYTTDLATYLSRQEEQQRGNPSLFLVSDPEQCLYGTESERNFLTQLFPNHQTLVGEQADQKTVIDTLRDGTGFDLIHFSCHGEYGWNYFDDGGIRLANGGKLSFRNVLENVKLHPGAIVVLASCESGITDYEHMPNETFGLQLAFLHAGAKAVISTLWPVDDRATSFLMGRFYEGLTKDLPPSEALRVSQLWLKRATNLELYGEGMQVPISSQVRISNQDGELSKITNADKNNRPFAHPVYWAGFTVYGA